MFLKHVTLFPTSGLLHLSASACIPLTSGIAWHALLNIHKVVAQMFTPELPLLHSVTLHSLSCFISFIAVITTWNYTLCICFTCLYSVSPSRR